MEINDLIGKPFRAGCDGPDAFDCWGLVVFLYRRELGIDLGDWRRGMTDIRNDDRVAAMIRERLPEWTRRDGPPEPLDVLLFRERGLEHHVGISLGGTAMINAREQNDFPGQPGVVVDDWKSATWAFGQTMIGAYSLTR